MDKGGKFAFICLVTKAANSRTMVSDQFLCFAHTHTHNKHIYTFSVRGAAYF